MNRRSLSFQNRKKLGGAVRRLRCIKSDKAKKKIYYSYVGIKI